MLKAITLTKDEQAMYFQRAKSGDREALGRLAQSFVKLVERIASKYSSCNYSDMVGSGMIGVLKGLESYDPKKGSMSTHLTWFARNEIRNEVSRTLFDSANSAEQATYVFNMVRLANVFRAVGVEPTYELLGRELGIAPTRLDGMMRLLRRAEINEEVAADSAHVDAEVLPALHVMVLNALYGIEGPQQSVMEVALDLDMTVEEVEAIAESGKQWLAAHILEV